MVTGAALVAGVLLQSVIRNPLGEPHILGLNAGGAGGSYHQRALGLSLPFGRRSRCRRWRRGAVSAGADVLLVWSHRADADESHAVRRGDVGICLIGDSPRH